MTILFGVVITWDKIKRYGQPFLLGILGASIFLWGYFSTSSYFLDTRQIIGITMALLSGIIFYFDNILQKLQENEVGVLQHENLSTAIANVYKDYPHTKDIRIFAITSFKIQPFFSDIRVTTNKCTILLSSKSNLVEESSSLASKQVHNINTIIQEWKCMTSDNLIQELSFYKYDFFPTEYYIVFDNKAIIIGHYLIDENRVVYVKTQDPFIVTDAFPGGSYLINKYIEVFDSIKDSKMAHEVELNESSEGESKNDKDST